MSRSLLVSLLLTLSSFSPTQPSAIAQSGKKTVAVLEFNSSSPEVGKNELTTLTNRFRTILVKTDVYDVLERQKMGDILKEQDFTLSDACNSAECAVQIGQLLGVEYMIAGDVGKLGNTYSVDLRLISVTTGKIIKTESQDHDGKIDGLFGALTMIGDRFAGIQSGVSTVKSEVTVGADGVRDMFTDSRDERKYITVRVGNQVWMAENLHFDTGMPTGDPGNRCFCLDDDAANCERFGRLYSWKAAREASPPGWHLPSKEEFEQLLIHLGGAGPASYRQLIEGGTSGMNVLFAGFYRTQERDVDTYFWTSTEKDAEDVWCVGANQATGEAFITDGHRSYGFSARCVKD